MSDKIIPFGMRFEFALKLGYAGRMESEKYLAWIRTLACDTCHTPGPSDPSHLDNYSKGHGTKSPDWWAIPECRRCHDVYERMSAHVEPEQRLARAAIYLTQAIFEKVIG